MHLFSSSFGFFFTNDDDVDAALAFTLGVFFVWPARANRPIFDEPLFLFFLDEDFDIELSGVSKYNKEV